MAPSKAQRVARYHKATLEELHHLCSAAGVTTIKCLSKKHIRRRIGPGEISSYYKLYPDYGPGSLLDGTADNRFQGLWDKVSHTTFNNK